MLPPAKRTGDPADEPAEAHCAAWLAADGRRALLAQVGVGTLDQALLAALPVRHAPLRLQGLSCKVLIVDEAHAFDPYMRRELVALLRFHAALGGSVVLLSATLPLAVRQGLVDAFRDGLEAAPQTLARRNTRSRRSPRLTVSRRHPATWIAARACPPRGSDAAGGHRRRAGAHRCCRIGGAAVAWVRNTVDDAIAAADALRVRGVDPLLLFHARFAMADRLEIEAEVLRRFGRKSAGEARRCVLVATQVVEQSLDIDFDLLCTDLAPADLLIQRAGRLWRHKRDAHARAVPGPELLVVSPKRWLIPRPIGSRGRCPAPPPSIETQLYCGAAPGKSSREAP